MIKNSYSVFGSGAWGTALANMIAENYGSVVLYSRNIDQVNNINNLHHNEDYLPNIILSNKINATHSIKEAAQSNVWFIAIPCQNLRAFLQEMKKYHSSDKKLILCCKGIDYDSLKFPSEIVETELPGAKIAILSGPNFAAEVAKLLPSATVLASFDADFAHKVRDDLSKNVFRIIVTTDLVSAEIGGATKNIIAILCGIAHGTKLGENIIASFIVQGLIETAIIATNRHGIAETIYGMAGLGDLILSCTSKSSRNFKFGYKLGENANLQELVNSNVTVEGYYSTKAIYELSRQMNLKLPIIECTYNILYQRYGINDAINLLLSQLWLKDEIID